jgi:F-type H+-transporting ATPase subunit epsilon
MNYQLDVVSVNGNVFSGEVKEVTLPGISGEITVLARHMPIVAPLTTGEVIIRTQNDAFFLSIGRGVFSYDSGIGRLLIEDVVAADEISEERALEAKRKPKNCYKKALPVKKKLRQCIN